MFGILAPSVASAQKSKTSSLDQKVTAMLDRAVKNFTKNANLAQRQIDSAFVFVKQKNSLSQSTIAYYHVVKGNEYKNTSKYDLAINSYLESLKIYEQLNDLGQIGIVKVNMASILLDLKQFDKAEAMAKAAIEVHRKNKHYNALSKAQSLLAGIFFNKGNAKEALPIIAEAIESAKNGKDSVQLISLYTNRIQTFFRFKQPEKATPDIEELEALAIKTRDQRGQANAQFYKGYVAKTQGRYKEADSLYEASYVYFDKIRDFYRQRDIFNAMSANALLMKDYEKAVNAKQWAGDILDSIFNEKQQKTINELNIKFDTEKKKNSSSNNRMSLNLHSSERPRPH